MWKRLKESAGGIKWESVSNIFRRKNYSKFESEESSDIDATCRPSYLRDEENNELCWNESRRHPSYPVGTPGNDSGYGSICTTPYTDQGSADRSIDTDHTDSRRSNSDVTNDFAHKNSRSFGIFGNDRPESDFDSISSPDRTFLSVSYKVKGEVKDVVNSYVQKRYNRLENEDEISDESGEIEDPNLSENNDIVFHSAKEVHPECRNKPKRITKKKIAKRTRRVLRTSWKWFRRGFMEYARSFNTPNVFVVINPGVYKKRT